MKKCSTDFEHLSFADMIKSTFEVTFFFHFCFKLSTSKYYYTDTIDILHSYYTSLSTRLIYTVSIIYNIRYIIKIINTSKADIFLAPPSAWRKLFSCYKRLK